MEQYRIIARSVTHAQRMERELRRLGIRAAVFHAPLELTAGRGCAYALAVAPAAIRAALQAIDGMRLRPAPGRREAPPRRRTIWRRCWPLSAQ